MNYWLSGEFYQDSRLCEELQRRQHKNPCSCGRPSEFAWRYRKGILWSCAKHWFEHGQGKTESGYPIGSFLDVVRLADGCFGSGGKEIISLQRGNARGMKLDGLETAAIFAEMKKRGWKW